MPFFVITYRCQLQPKVLDLKSFRYPNYKEIIHPKKILVNQCIGGCHLNDVFEVEMSFHAMFLQFANAG